MKRSDWGCDKANAISTINKLIKKLNDKEKESCD